MMDMKIDVSCIGGSDDCCSDMLVILQMLVLTLGGYAYKIAISDDVF